VKKYKIIKILKLFTLLMAFGILVGCKSKTPMTHNEIGSAVGITTDIYNECKANNDIQGAKEALETLRYLNAFCCDSVNYEDAKNRNYNNIQYNIGELQLAVTAYNENNDESAMDVEVDWICQFNSCTQEQHDAIDAYVYWFDHCQNGNYEGTIKEYKDIFDAAYTRMRNDYGIKKAPRYNDLTSAQFKEVQNYMADPENYQVDVTAWK